MPLVLTLLMRLLCAALCALPAMATAQMSLLPPACANLTGEALDKCVRDITIEQVTPQMVTIAPPPPDPSQPVNCTHGLAADLNFCIWRNEIVLHCRNKAKFPDFQTCFDANIPNVAKPTTANCAREKPKMQAACKARNSYFAKCLENPLSYFLCLANNGTLPERMLKP